MENPNKPFGQLNIKSANALLVDPKHSDLEACVWGFIFPWGTSMRTTTGWVFVPQSVFSLPSSSMWGPITFCETENGALTPWTKPPLE